MTKILLSQIAAKLNRKSASHSIGSLQRLRKRLKGKTRLPNKIFQIGGTANTVFGDYAFHYGGRTELQFNIGTDGSRNTLRHGVAFSFETSPTLPDVDILKPKVRLFNDYLQQNPEKFGSMRMWHYDGAQRIGDYMPSPIPDERIKKGVFVFLGKRQKIDQLDYESILNHFDELLPLYQYVESRGRLEPTFARESQFAFRSGCPVKATAASAALLKNTLDITLRHNELQMSLHRQLAQQFGADFVGTEIASGVGTSVDLVVKLPDGFWFYEIKTAHSPRACIREAIGQLLEYAFWPGAQPAVKLVVVGESPLDPDGKKYLDELRNRFSLPIYYEQITL